VTVVTRPWVRRGLTVVTLVLAGIAAYTLGVALRPPPEVAGTALQHPPSMVDLELVRGDGAEVRLGDALADTTTLVFFGFTRCPDVCPFTMARLATLYEDMGRPDDLQVAMITVDPEHDAPALLQTYVRGFHEDFIAFSGSTAQIATAARAFFVGYAGIGTETFTHTDVVAVLDRRGALRYVYSQQNLPRLPVDLPAILAQSGF
jgi:protein SCO1